VWIFNQKKNQPALRAAKVSQTDRYLPERNNLNREGGHVH
jgi:hypothetical protein